MPGCTPSRGKSRTLENAASTTQRHSPAVARWTAIGTFPGASTGYLAALRFKAAVLDVGAASGFLSYHMEGKGAEGRFLRSV